jgi:hypothetical protein
MDKTRITLLIINLIGGAAVLGSYALGLKAHPGGGNALWGGVPTAIRPFYGFAMLFAASGYLLILYVLLFRVDSSATIGSMPFWTFNLIYIFILVPSSLWMSLTFAVFEQYTLGRWLVVILVLTLAGLASIGLLAAFLMLAPRPLSTLYWVAVVGGFFLVLQTAVLDAIVWTSYYLK